MRGFMRQWRLGDFEFVSDAAQGEESLVQMTFTFEQSWLKDRTATMKKHCCDADLGMHSWKSEMEAEEPGGGQLIPGIQDEITIFHILTKLPWDAMFPISEVNKTWQKVVQSRQIFKARVNANATQILVPIMHSSPGIYAGNLQPKRLFEQYNLYNEAISLYDPSNDKWYLLPPVPPFSAGIPDACGCVCFNGKVYILGGLEVSAKSSCGDVNLGEYDQVSRKEVYSLDLAAGEKKWKRCADMTCARSWFQCGVNDGNIYVFWGVNGWGGRREQEKDAERAVVEVEVYDPEEDLWDLVAPVPFPDIVKYSLLNKVTAAEDSFVIHSYFRSDNREFFAVEHTYDTGMDEWKILAHTKGEMDPTHTFVTLGEKVIKIDPKNSNLKVYDEPSRSWKSGNYTVHWKFLDPYIQTLPFKAYSACPTLPTLAPLPWQTRAKLKEVQDLLAVTQIKVGSEEIIVALTRTSDIISQFRSYPKQLALFKGKWEGPQDKLQLIFQEVDCPYKLVDWQKSSLSPLQL